ncbi:winged helix-turn-helix domain-containing protein [Rhizomonospora bruguierae]|uniref:winged helix-turn-helix domain-containing protein n=1 Tax=Rhizomonospora bruguierae TaxID=1581705 RepID=UPI001BCCEC41|nr:winged helix-turn-helix domain-containing protein [Micromonospora sp. NBRC 107566]
MTVTRLDSAYRSLVAEADPDRPHLLVTVQVPVPAGPDAATHAGRVAERLREACRDLPGGPADAQVVTTVSVLLDTLDAGVPPAPAAPAPNPARRADLVLMPLRRLALLRGEPLEMTRREYDLLLFLARNGERVFTRGQLLRQVWGYAVPSGERTVDVHVRRLRVKLAGRGPEINTIRGVGYRLDRLDRLTLIDPYGEATLAA